MTKITNRVREAWADKSPALGVWLALPGLGGAQMCADNSLDYACIDQQHGLIDYMQFVEMLPSISAQRVTPVTRVPDLSPAYIGKVLDAGAQGVIVPMVNNREDANVVVQACRYPPAGIRSYGPIRSSISLGSRDPEELGADALAIVMIETLEGLENVDEIAATPGLDAIYVGPADLALALGLPPDLDKDEPEHVRAVRRIRDACRAHGVAPGIQCGSGEAAFRFLEDGFTFVTVTKDSALLTGGVARELAAAHGRGPAAAAAYT